MYKRVYIFFSFSFYFQFLRKCILKQMFFTNQIFGRSSADGPCAIYWSRLIHRREADSDGHHVYDSTRMTLPWNTLVGAFRIYRHKTETVLSNRVRDPQTLSQIARRVFTTEQTTRMRRIEEEGLEIISDFVNRVLKTKNMKGISIY